MFSAAPNVDNANTANYANYANFSGEAFSVTGSNVSGTVANATHSVHADEANSVSGGNVIGQVGNALIAGTVYTNAQPNITSVGTLTNLFVTGDIESFANITGDYFLGNGAFLTGVGDFSAALGYHGSFFSNVSQTIASTTTAYPITLNNTSPGTYGVFVASNSRVTFTYAGTYNIQYSVQFTNTDNAVYDASIWLRKNGVDVPDTNSVFAVTASHGGTNGQLIGSVNYIQDVNANDYYELIWQAESTSVSLEYIAPGTTPTSPAAPSVIVTAMQVTNVQAATLSGNLTGDLIGNSYGLTGTSFINIIGNIQGGHFIGNASGLTGIVGGNVVGAVANATHATIADASNVSYSVSGANVSGAVANATYAVTAGEAYAVSAANIVGVINLANFATVANSVAGSNVSGEVNFANIANSVAGANVSGFVANANVANTAYAVAVANVSGIGNIATLNLDGNAGNILYGNGIFATAPTVSNVANANYANFAGTAYSVDAANISVTINLANFATTANAVAGANVSGEVANATYATNAGTAYSVSGANVSGTVANATYATNAGSATTAGTANSVAGANVSGEVATATYATSAGSATTATTAGTVTTNAQPNITSVGTLSSLTVTGLINGNVTAVSNIWARQANNITLYSATGSTNTFRITFASSNYASTNSDISIHPGNLTYQPSTGTVTATTFVGALTGLASSATVAASANSVAGANVSGTVASATIAASANSVAGANVSGEVANATYATNAGTAYSVSASNISGTINLANFATTANSVAVANVSGIGNIATTNYNGNGSQVLAGNGAWVAQSGGGGGNGTPGGSNTQIQFNDNGSFGCISTVTWNGSKLNLGAVANINITGGSNLDVVSTDGAGNLSFRNIVPTLLVGTRGGAYTVPITNYTFQVTTRSGSNVTVYVN